MNGVVRPSTPADGPAISALLADAQMYPANQDELQHWKYWRARSDMPGPRSFVLAQDNELLAHCGVVPCIYAWGEQRIELLHTIDWAAHRASPGAGIALMKRLSQLADGLLAIGGSSQMLEIAPHIGFRPHGLATSFVRPLRPWLMLRNETSRTWRAGARFARHTLQALAGPAMSTQGWEVQRLAAHDLRRVTSVLPTPSPAMAILERSEALFRYVLSCPVAAPELHAVSKGTVVRGYLLLVFAKSQVRLADCWIDSSDPADWRSLIHCAVRLALQTPTGAELVARASDQAFASCLRDCGFHARRTAPIHVLAGKDASLPIAPLRVQLLDNDAYFS